jgi:hypothetical protein
MAQLDDPEGRALTRLYLETAGYNYEMLRLLADHLTENGPGRDVCRLRASLDQYEAALDELRSRTGMPRA